MDLKPIDDFVLTPDAYGFVAVKIIKRMPTLAEAIREWEWQQRVVPIDLDSFVSWYCSERRQVSPAYEWDGGRWGQTLRVSYIQI